MPSMQQLQVASECDLPWSLTFVFTVTSNHDDTELGLLPLNSNKMENRLDKSIRNSR
jgi:hypothetical protein